MANVLHGSVERALLLLPLSEILIAGRQLRAARCPLRCSLRTVSWEQWQNGKTAIECQASALFGPAHMSAAILR